ncbi:N-formylglutamate amidohydrolase [Pelagicoccus albus]|uniref:N-formylglutamate amidohydrolase n=1 Tax=Pelagicoccus albus TaxID=415222 RepID=A0A7X1E8V1_9BACT|nr:N-formylglutamate amidohydrolase [Pelagicoccus albus]MBC2607145.1 N-formylglutamate amidohydrolase [Pelagicoccus albus]
MGSRSLYGFVVTAEHASDAIPSSCSDILQREFDASDVHQRFDPGTKSIAESLAVKLEATLCLGKFTRLAIDLNRSIGGPDLFSKSLFRADEELKASLIQNHFLPFRKEAKEAVEALIQNKKIATHLSIHSFTPVLNGVVRNLDIGVLYDDESSGETKLANHLIQCLSADFPKLKVAANKPYLGKSDGHTTALRRIFPDTNYLGIEFEFNQALDFQRDSEALVDSILTSLRFYTA